MSPPVYFLSYSRDNLHDITMIARVLKTYGIRTWQDLDDLGTGLSEDRIRNAIQNETSGLLFYSTPESVSSEFVKQVELREAEFVHKNNSNFIFVPVFGLSISETDAALKGTLTVPISNFNGVKVDRTDDPRAIRYAAHRAAELVLQRLIVKERYPLPIGFTSKQTPPSGVSLDIDFTPFFENGLPDEEEWNTDFPRALDQVKSALLARSLTQLRLRTFAHLSLGLLFGFVFRERTGFCLEIEQTTRGEGTTIWTIPGEALPHALSMSEYPAQLDSKNLCVKINLVARDDASVAAYADKSGLDYRVLLDVTPPQYPHFISSGHAIGIARDLADRIKKIHGKYGTNSVHLFAAVPLGLAILIGYNLNACGSIQCYEFDNASREYHPSCLLR